MSIRTTLGTGNVAIVYLKATKKVMYKEQEFTEDGELGNENNGDHEDTAREECIDKPMHPTGKEKEEHDNPTRSPPNYLREELDDCAVQKLFLKAATS